MNPIKWIFNRPEYGGYSFDDKLYRRFPRSGQVQEKADFGWCDIEKESEFIADEYQCAMMPNHELEMWECSWRDFVGETYFKKWLERKRQEALRRKLVRNLVSKGTK